MTVDLRDKQRHIKQVKNQVDGFTCPYKKPASPLSLELNTPQKTIQKDLQMSKLVMLTLGIKTYLTNIRVIILNYQAGTLSLKAKPNQLLKTKQLPEASTA